MSLPRSHPMRAGGRLSRRLLLRVSAWLAVGAGTGLLLVALLGDFTRLGQYRVYQPMSWDSHDPELVVRTRDRAALIAEAVQRVEASGAERSDRTLMNALYLVTIERFVHGAAEHTPFTNWVVWARGLPNEHQIRLRDTDELLRRGHAALCGQISQLLADMARELGIEARLIQLEGHVVMEAYFDGAWHMYDADAEVGASSLFDAPPAIDELIADPDRLTALYAPNNPQMVPVILSTDNNWIGDQDQYRVRLESIGSVAKYTVPLLMMMVGLLVLRRTSP
jgi:hypothetical protein